MLYSSVDCFLFDVECVPDNSIINNSNNTATTSTTANDNDAIRLHTIPFVFVFKTHMLPHYYTRDARKKMNEYILYRKSEKTVPVIQNTQDGDHLFLFLTTFVSS